jgi:hypothetical protein
VAVRININTEREAAESIVDLSWNQRSLQTRRLSMLSSSGSAETWIQIRNVEYENEQYRCVIKRTHNIGEEKRPP